MRIIAGSHKGIRLATPKGKGIRPALDQVKEAIFNILYDVSELEVLDLFAGTGNVGLEALSRHAASCTFVDNGREAISLIFKNIEITGFKERSRVITRPVALAIRQLSKQKKSFDLIFVDPPYEKNLVNPTLQMLSERCLLKGDGKIIVEHHPKEAITSPTPFELTDQRKYGQTLISFLGWKVK